MREQEEKFTIDIPHTLNDNSKRGEWQNSLYAWTERHKGNKQYEEDTQNEFENNLQETLDKNRK